MRKFGLCFMLSRFFKLKNSENDARSKIHQSRFTVPATIFLLVLLLFGCASNTSPAFDLQKTYDDSLYAKGFADSCLNEMLDQKGVIDYEINQTSVGFTADDTTFYVISYQYTHDSRAEQYGYILKKEGEEFSIYKEGEGIAVFLTDDK